MYANSWLQRAMSNLLPLSNNKNDFLQAKNEWIYIGLFDNEGADFDCELCGQKDIRYEYTIQNKFNNNEMIVGSSCITKFIDYMFENNEFLLDEIGNQVTSQRLEQDKHEYWKKILFEALDERFSSGDFQQSITDKIKEDGKLTINQAKCLRAFYDDLNQNEQTAFRNIVKIRLRREIHKEQYASLDGANKDFILILMNAQQRNRMAKLYD